jgi:hypothetical protein
VTTIGVRGLKLWGWQAGSAGLADQRPQNVILGATWQAAKAQRMIRGLDV